MTEPRRDRFGRYILTDPRTGQEHAWTRATTFADSIEDTYNLTLWKQRATAVGLGMRPDLMALAQSLKLDEDKKALDELCEKAKDAAAADSRSNLGTALHKMTERLDRLEKFTPPAAYRADMLAYNRLKAENGLQTAPCYVERIIAVPEYRVAGTPDRIARYQGEVCIADLKTGYDLKYSWGKIAVQLALYSRGEGLWDADNGTWEDMPPVSQDFGIVIHLPVGEPKPGQERQHPALYKVDLNAGWEAAQLCAHVRQWRNRRNLHEQVSA